VTQLVSESERHEEPLNARARKNLRMGWDGKFEVLLLEMSKSWEGRMT
jgi:hypothetical protein